MSIKARPALEPLRWGNAAISAPHRIGYPRLATRSERLRSAGQRRLVRAGQGAIASAKGIVRAALSLVRPNRGIIQELSPGVS